MSKKAPSIGHNSFAPDKLKQMIERIERLEEEKAELAQDITEVFGEAKSLGFDCKVIRAILRERKMDSSKLAEFREIMNLYREALGMFVETELGAATIARAEQEAKTRPSRAKKEGAA